LLPKPMSEDETIPIVWTTVFACDLLELYIAKRYAAQAGKYAAVDFRRKSTNSLCDRVQFPRRRLMEAPLTVVRKSASVPLQFSAAARFWFSANPFLGFT